MGVCDFLLGNKFELRIEKVELGKHHEVEPYVEYDPRIDCDEGGGCIRWPGYTYFDIYVQAELTPLKRPDSHIFVNKSYKSDRFKPKSRLEQEIWGINRLIQEEGIVLQARVRVEVPPVTVTSDSQYAKDVSERLPKSLYDRIVDYVEGRNEIKEKIQKLRNLVAPLESVRVNIHYQNEIGPDHHIHPELWRGERFLGFLDEGLVPYATALEKVVSCEIEQRGDELLVDMVGCNEKESKGTYYIRLIVPRIVPHG